MNGRAVLTSSSTDLGAGADVGAVAAERLAERADDHVHLAAEPGLGDRAAAARAQGADRVRLVDHRAGSGVARASSTSSTSGATSPSIEKTRVGDDQRGPAAGPLEAPGEVLEVAVAVDEGLGAGEPAAVDDRWRGSARRRRRRSPRPASAETVPMFAR